MTQSNRLTRRRTHGHVNHAINTSVSYTHGLAGQGREEGSIRTPFLSRSLGGESTLATPSDLYGHVLRLEPHGLTIWRLQKVPASLPVLS